MITNNTKILFQCLGLAGSTPVPISKLKNIEGEYKTSYGNTSIANLMANSYVAVGSNDTEPSTQDYNLKEKINELTKISTTIIPNSSTVTDFDNTTTGYGVNTVYKNNTNNPITIKEVGILSPTNNDNYKFLFTRNLVTKTVNPGETVSITVYIG